MVIERPSTNNGGKLLIFGIELQTWAFIVANIVALTGFYFSLRNDVDNLKSHYNETPSWAILLTTKVDRLQEKQTEVYQYISKVDIEGTRGLITLKAQLSSQMTECKQENVYQEKRMNEIEQQVNDLQDVYRIIVQYFGHPSLPQLDKKKATPK